MLLGQGTRSSEPMSTFVIYHHLPHILVSIQVLSVNLMVICLVVQVTSLFSIYYTVRENHVSKAMTRSSRPMSTLPLEIVSYKHAVKDTRSKQKRVYTWCELWWQRLGQHQCTPNSPHKLKLSCSPLQLVCQRQLLVIEPYPLSE